MVVGIDGAVVGAVDIVLDGPGWSRTVLNAALSAVVCVVRRVHRAVLDASMINAIFEGHDRRRRTSYLSNAILETHFLVESSANFEMLEQPG